MYVYTYINTYVHTYDIGRNIYVRLYIHKYIHIRMIHTYRCTRRTSTATSPSTPLKRWCETLDPSTMSSNWSLFTQLPRAWSASAADGGGTWRCVGSVPGYRATCSNWSGLNKTKLCFLNPNPYPGVAQTKPNSTTWITGVVPYEQLVVVCTNNCSSTTWITAAVPYE